MINLQSILRRAVALGTILLFAVGPSVLAAPVAQGAEGTLDAAVIDNDTGKTPTALASSRFRIKCYSKDANGVDRVDNAKLDTCLSPNHAAFCTEQGKFQCAHLDQCAGCACV